MGFYVCVLVQFKMELINKKFCVWNIEPHWPYYVYLTIHVYCSQIVGRFFLKFLNAKSTNTLNPKHTKSRSGHKLGSVRLRINLPINQIRSGFKTCTRCRLRSLCSLAWHPFWIFGWNHWFCWVACWQNLVTISLQKLSSNNRSAKFFIQDNGD